MIDFQFIPALQKYGGSDHFLFQQDGDTPHCTAQTSELLKVYFDERLISRRAEIEWPASSPDLRPLDFYLWGHLDKLVKKVHQKQKLN